MSIKVATILFGVFMLCSGKAIAQCIVQTGSLNFGNYHHAQDTLTSATIDVNCSQGILYRVELSAGNGNYSARQMQGSNGGRLYYNLYTRADYAQVWGDGNAGTGVMGGVGMGANRPANVYGLIPAGQQSLAGSYFDNIVIIVNF